MVVFAPGHGLTYGRIGYGALSVCDARSSWDGTLEMCATITNTGSRAAEEVVQLYIQDVAASITRRIRQLIAFEKVSVAPGASQLVGFRMRRSDLLYVGQDGRPTVLAGIFRVWIAPSAQADGARGQFELVAPNR